MFANLKATLLKVDLRKGGKKVFVFESSVRLTGGELEALNDMIHQEVALGIDSQVISYNIRKNAKTDQPIIHYKVNDSGVVEQVKPEGEQAEMDLGLPVEKTQIKEELAEISREIVEEFIAEGLEPKFDDLKYDISAIIREHAEGESYLRIASRLELSSGKLLELLEDYYKRVAPMAAKWNEWREGKQKEVKKVITQTINQNADQPQSEEDTTGESERNSEDQEKEEPDPAVEVQGKDELENFILSGNAPSYDDLPFDFPALLKEKRSGKTWVEVASSIGLGSGQLSAKWNEYKNRVKAYMNGEEHGAA